MCEKLTFILLYTQAYLLSVLLSDYFFDDAVTAWFIESLSLGVSVSFLFPTLRAPLPTTDLTENSGHPWILMQNLMDDLIPNA